MSEVAANTARLRLWTPAVRALVFILAASSIWCLLAEFYGLCSMRTFTFYISIPALVVLSALVLVDWRSGDRRLMRNVLIGMAAGMIAAVAYDIFRVPFVFSRAWGLTGIVPQMDLYKVFPRFGAMILGQPIEQPVYSLAAQLIGWTYHFSNGITFGVMYAAAIGEGSRRHWAWAVLMAVGLELAMLYTPYPQMFAINVGAAFVAVTLTAHLIFGTVLGLYMRRLCTR
jgi:hypothetical protein